MFVQVWSGLPRHWLDPLQEQGLPAREPGACFSPPSRVLLFSTPMTHNSRSPASQDLLNLTAGNALCQPLHSLL